METTPPSASAAWPGWFSRPKASSIVRPASEMRDSGTGPRPDLHRDHHRLFPLREHLPGSRRHRLHHLDHQGDFQRNHQRGASPSPAEPARPRTSFPAPTRPRPSSPPTTATAAPWSTIRRHVRRHRVERRDGSPVATHLGRPGTASTDAARL